MALAVWRISHLFVEEAGPFDILAKFRHILGVRYDQFSVPYGESVAAQLFTCVWCLSVWVGSAVGLAYLFSPETTVNVCLLPALSAGAIVVNELVGDR